MARRSIILSPVSLLSLASPIWHRIVHPSSHPDACDGEDGPFCWRSAARCFDFGLKSKKGFSVLYKRFWKAKTRLEGCPTIKHYFLHCYCSLPSASVPSTDPIISAQATSHSQNALVLLGLAAAAPPPPNVISTLVLFRLLLLEQLTLRLHLPEDAEGGGPKTPSQRPPSGLSPPELRVLGWGVYCGRGVQIERHA